MHLFLNGGIKEEVCIEKPLGFEDYDHPNWVYQLHKVLNSLKQAPRVWHEKLSNFLISHGYVKGHVDMTLFIQRVENDMIVILI